MGARIMETIFFTIICLTSIYLSFGPPKPNNLHRNLLLGFSFVKSVVTSHMAVDTYTILMLTLLLLITWRFSTITRIACCLSIGIHGYVADNWSTPQLMTLVILVLIVVTYPSINTPWIKLRQGTREFWKRVLIGGCVVAGGTVLLRYTLAASHAPLSTLLWVFRVVVLYPGAWMSLSVGIRAVFMMIWSYTHNGYIDNLVPGPPRHILFGNLLQAVPIKAADIKIFHRWAMEFPVMFTYMVTSFLPMVYVHHPEPVRKILSPNFPKERKYAYKPLENFTGEGLIISDSSKWSKHRKILSKAFHLNAVRGFQPKILDCCETFVEKLKNQKGTPIDIRTESRVFALDVLLRCTFAMDGSWQYDRRVREFTDIVARCIVHVSDGIYNPLFYYPPLYNLLPRGRHFRDEVTRARKFAEEVLNECRKRGTEGSIVAHMMDHLPLEDIINEVTTLLFAGHDTTAHSLTFTLGLLARHGSAWRRCQEEVNRFTGIPTDITADTFVEHFPYLDQCMKESLRLFPSVPMVGRRTDRPVEVAGKSFPSGTWFCVNIYSLHRHDAFWEHPHEFMPERWEAAGACPTSGSTSGPITPFTYIPFSCGPRNCLGARFARTTLAFALFHVLRRFEEAECVEFGEADLSVVLHPTAMKIRFWEERRD